MTQQQYHVTGRYEWTERRLYSCVANLDCVVTADSAEAAIDRAIDQLYGVPDYDWREGDTEFDDDFVKFRDQTKIKAVELQDGYDPALDNKLNLELMRRNSQPLFAEYK